MTTPPGLPPPTDPSTAPGALTLGAQPGIPDHVLEAALGFWREQRCTQWWQVTGRSMLPLLQAGDELQVQHGVQELRLGDIVLCRLQGQWIAHRIVRIQGAVPQRLITTQGDNVAAVDPPIPEDAIAGRALAVRRGADVVRLDTGRRRVHALGLVARARLEMAWRRLVRSLGRVTGRR